jgi:hypothetical protein
MIPTQERRVSGRVPVDWVVKYYYEVPTANPRITRMVDLSEGGARLETFAPLIPGSSVAFQVVTPERHAIDVRAKVLYLEPRQQLPYHVGIKFTALSPGDRAILARELTRAVA